MKNYVSHISWPYVNHHMRVRRKFTGFFLLTWFLCSFIVSIITIRHVQLLEKQDESQNIPCCNIPVCNLDLRTSGPIATTQLKMPAIPPANNVRLMLSWLRLKTKYQNHIKGQPSVKIHLTTAISYWMGDILYTHFYNKEYRELV